MLKKRPNVLTPSRQAFFSLLGFTKRYGLYLAGGTALALQIMHRASVDFDFYTQRHFTKGLLAKAFRRTITGREIRIARDIDDTFEINIAPDIHLSCFYYDYTLLETPRSINGIAVAGLKDIAAMKIVAISQRGTRRDFIDVYYLLQRFTLREMLRFTQEKYAHFDIYNGLRGLLYFENADHDVALERAVVFDRTLTWEKVKKSIVQTVQEFQKAVRES